MVNDKSSYHNKLYLKLKMYMLTFRQCVSQTISHSKFKTRSSPEHASFLTTLIHFKEFQCSPGAYVLPWAFHEESKQLG